MWHPPSQAQPLLHHYNIHNHIIISFSSTQLKVIASTGTDVDGSSTDELINVDDENAFWSDLKDMQSPRPLFRDV